jgi:hypothetical protein
MATSSSSDALWRASALIFSGRANPQWAISDASAAQLVPVWSALPATHARATAPGLGYSGCVLLDGERRWHAFDGIAILTSAGRVEIRADANRAFEFAILATAPPGTIPDSVRF